MEKVCPNCGYCPTCGKPNYWSYPYPILQPYVYTQGTSSAAIPITDSKITITSNG